MAGDDEQLTFIATASGETSVANLTLEHLRGVRRELGAILENQASFAKQITRLYTHVDRLSDEVRALTAEVRSDFKEVRSDILHLENQNLSRHGETLNILRKLEGDPLS